MNRMQKNRGLGKIAMLMLLILVFLSCERAEYIITEGESKVVVEGWIDEGDVARVLITRSIPVTEPVDSSSIIRYTIRSAMVIVSDGEINDTLRLKSEPHRLPPFLYVGEKIIGQTGGKYTLTVKYLNQTLTAESVIPPTVPLNAVRYVRENPTDTIGNLVVEFTHPVSQQHYYQIATRLEGYDAIFVPCLYGNLNSRNFTSPDVSMQLMRGITIFPKTSFESHFSDGDIIFVRLRTMPKEGFDFWNSWQNEIINTQNAIFPSNSSLKSNIKGGIGIWCGYGESTMVVVAR